MTTLLDARLDDRSRRTRQRGLALATKRAIDVVGAAGLLALLAPVMLAVALAVKLDSRGPVLFRQERVGLGHRRFTVLKFRSMVVDADPAVHAAYLRSQAIAEAACEGPELFKVQDDPRVTRVGAFIRRTSLDELPQLWNVLVGEMSLVGPRPDVPYSLEQYEPRHHRRFDVLPGLTGLWQVSGRSTLSLRQMLDLDVRYVETWSLSLDLRLLVRTIPELLRPDRAG